MPAITLDDGTVLDRLPEDAETAARIVAVSGYLYLEGYPHPLPGGLTTTGNLDLRGYEHPLPAGIAGSLTIPVLPGIDAAILAAIEGGGTLDMEKWHACGTEHCRAGWAVHLAGDAGYALEKRIGAAGAGALIYEASRPGIPRPDFYASYADAMADLGACADMARLFEQAVASDNIVGFPRRRA